MAKKTVVVDWDHTLVDSEGKWCVDVVTKETGAQFIQRLQRDDFTVVVLSARASYAAGKAEIEAKLKDSRIRNVEVTNNKPPAFAYVDDRAVKVEPDKPDFRAAFKEVQSLVKRPH